MLLALTIAATCSPAIATPSGNLSKAACSQIALATVIQGRWQIVVLDVRTQTLRQLTPSLEEQQAPAWSPDGQAIAFAGRSKENWDVYIFHLADGRLQRLTDSPSYDGTPAWSPAGTSIVFESSRSGNLEIYTVRADGQDLTRITDDPAADVEPIWSIDGTSLIISSWRSGARQLYTIDIASGASRPLTPAGQEARRPALSPDQRYLAYEGTDQTVSGIMIREMDSGTIADISPSLRQATWAAWATADPTLGASPPELLTLSPVHKDLYQYPTDWQITTQPYSPSIAVPSLATPILRTVLSGQWQHLVCAPRNAAQIIGPLYPLRVSQSLRFSPGTSQQLVALLAVRALKPRLVTSSAASFQRLRQTIKQASGFDFLDTLNDVWRGVDHPSSAYLSWHKTGRAIDVRDWYAPDGRPRLFITRQELNGQLYFRLYLLAARQDGSQGAPLRESLWRTEGRLSDPKLSAAGGQFAPPPPDYVVDVTDLAEREGWTRIPALTPPHGDWRRHYRDLEFWHYEHREGLIWYAAMQQIYDDTFLQSRFTAERARQHGYSESEMVAAGIWDTLSAVLRCDSSSFKRLCAN